MHIDNTQAFEPQLRALIEAHSPVHVDLMFEPSVGGWCAEHGEWNPADPPAAAVRDMDTGGLGIVIRHSLSEERVMGVLDRIEFGPHAAHVGRLDTPLRFMQHLTLHELAHHNGIPQEREDDCDGWAFDRLP